MLFSYKASGQVSFLSLSQALLLASTEIFKIYRLTPVSFEDGEIRQQIEEIQAKNFLEIGQVALITLSLGTLCNNDAGIKPVIVSRVSNLLTVVWSMLMQTDTY